MSEWRKEEEIMRKRERERERGERERGEREREGENKILSKPQSHNPTIPVNKHQRMIIAPMQRMTVISLRTLYSVRVRLLLDRQ